MPWFGRPLYGLVVGLLCALVIGGCTSPTKAPPGGSPTAGPVGGLPPDTTTLWLSDGNAASDTVIINCQGGPADSLTFQRAGRSNLRYLPGYRRFNIAFLHQAQTINRALYESEGEFSIEEAEAEVELTTEMLDRAVRYHKNRGRTVIVIGTSYGAFVIQHYLANRAPRADKYVVVAGRLDMSKEMVDETIDGWAGEFEEDGITYIPADKSEVESLAERRERVVKNRLKAAIGNDRYTQMLREADLSKVIYYYATNDQAVGALTGQEVDFLETRGATVYPTSDGHADVFYRFVDAVMAGSLTL